MADGEKLNWLKRPKTVPKNEIWARKYMIQKHLFGVYLLISNFLLESQNQQKLATKIIGFTIQFHSRKITHFTNLNSLSIIKNILFEHSQKPHSLNNFSSKPGSCWCQMKHLHYIISRYPKTAFSKHLESKCLYIHVNIRKKFFVPET